MDYRDKCFGLGSPYGALRRHKNSISGFSERKYQKINQNYPFKPVRIYR